MIDQNSPFVSFCMTSYNQREYALIALKAALVQDYPNMEIIVADDASTDGSAKVLQKCAAESGRDNVHIMTAESNLGRTKNFERLFLAAKGELIISADGDDISEPNRVSRIVEEWVKGGKRATIIVHDGIKIDPKGRPIGYVGVRSADCPLGACMAFSPRVVRDFEAATVPGSAQDHVLPRRGLWIGEVLRMNDRLVRYRVGTGVSSILYRRRRPELQMTGIRIAGYRQNILDLDYCCRKGMLDASKVEELKRSCEEGIRRNAAIAQLISGRTFVERWHALRTLYPRMLRDRASWLRLPYLLPEPLADAIYFCYDSAKTALRLLLYKGKV